MGLEARQKKRSSAERQGREQRRVIVVAFLGAIVVAVFFSQLVSIYPLAFASSFLLVGAVGLLGLRRPAMAVGLVIVLALVGDGRVWPEWPIIKNLSSRESFLYISDALTVSPAELLLTALVFVRILDRLFGGEEAQFELGPFVAPMLVFSAGIVFGLVWGLGAGADLRIAIIEMRPLLLIPMAYFLVSDTFTSIGHYRMLAFGVFGAVTFEAVRGLLVLENFGLDYVGAASPIEHTAALHQNIPVLMTIGLFVFGTKRFGLRPTAVVAVLPVLWLYLIAERRASIVALIIGLAVLAVLLQSRNRSRFNLLVPFAVVFLAVYTAGF